MAHRSDRRGIVPITPATFGVVEPIGSPRASLHRGQEPERSTQRAEDTAAVDLQPSQASCIKGGVQIGRYKLRVQGPSLDPMDLILLVLMDARAPGPRSFLPYR